MLKIAMYWISSSVAEVCCWHSIVFWYQWCKENTCLLKRQSLEQPKEEDLQICCMFVQYLPPKKNHNVIYLLKKHLHETRINVCTQEAIVTNNQFLFRGKEVNNMSKTNCRLDLHLCLYSMLILHLFLQKERTSKQKISTPYGADTQRECPRTQSDCVRTSVDYAEIDSLIQIKQ